MKLLDHGLISQKSRDLFARSLNLTKIRNYFCIGNPVDWVHEWWTTAGSNGPPWTDGGEDRRLVGCGGALTGGGHQGSGSGLEAERRQ
jgi:hypothetical protein